MNTYKPFQHILFRVDSIHKWQAQLVDLQIYAEDEQYVRLMNGHIIKSENDMTLIVPYNEETKHLHGTYLNYTPQEKESDILNDEHKCAYCANKGKDLDDNVCYCNVSNKQKMKYNERICELFKPMEVTPSSVTSEQSKITEILRYIEELNEDCLSMTPAKKNIASKLLSQIRTRILEII